ncbi:tetratricopeptide repeat protein [Mangrovivirga sp. M17]|uniref:Tetratricopeptide repeat protein n=1 Tax=Mangrovivirga halotolerans TaxID=2993936 RepID=A0ABT3RLZ4_9BACT|nr:adenylate/guanylate cyclase domain-containing protein [Mangrovivirga halotolerans]MCX2742729.1 tetratricopeptide repeat protein [Mangrovivirga halotolerans]
MKYIFQPFIILLFSLTFISKGQTDNIDSIKSLLEQTSEDTSKVNHLIGLSIEYRNESKLDKSKTTANEALSISREINYPKGEAHALKQIGMVEYYKGKYNAVLETWTEAHEIFGEINDLEGMSNMANNIGAIFYSMGNQPKALEYYLESLGIAEKQNIPTRIATSLANIGGVYGQMKNYEKALTYYERMDQYLLKLDNDQLTAGQLMGIGEIYYKQNKFKEALEKFEKSLFLSENTLDYAYNLIMLGKIETALNNDKKAIEYLSQANKYAIENELQLDHVQSLLSLGDIYIKTDPDKAIDTYQKAQEIALDMGISGELRDVYLGLYKAYQYKGKYEEALAFHEQYLAQKDSLFNIATDDRIRGLQFEFELDKKQNQIGLLEKEREIAQLNEKRQKNLTLATGIGAGLIFIIALGIFNRYRFIQKTNRLISIEKARSDNLLLNILPKETANELKQYGKVKAKRFDEVTVMFTDFKGFTYYSETLSPEDLVKSVDYYFAEFDVIMEKYGIEKIKTIGDAYMCASGMPFPDNHNPENMVLAAMEILEVMNNVKKEQPDIFPFEIRIGINTGPVVAGVVGIKKFAYDIWGDTVNVAARMESSSTPGKINISETTYELVKNKFECVYRGEIDVKNKGHLNMYYIEGIKNEEEEQVDVKHSGKIS